MPGARPVNVPAMMPVTSAKISSINIPLIEIPRLIKFLALVNHFLPYEIFIGRRKKGWQWKACEAGVYTLEPLGRGLTSEEKNAIYDNM